MAIRVLIMAQVVFLGVCVAQQQPSIGKLRLLVFGPAGTVVDPDTLTTEVRDLKSVDNHKGALRGGIADLPYGLYEVRISGTGFLPCEKKVEINQRLTTLRVELSLGDFYDGDMYNEISGRVEGMPDYADVWVKVFPLLNDHFPTVAREVSADGEFVVGGVPPGQYVISLMDNLDVLFASRIVVIGRHKVVLVVGEEGRITMTAIATAPKGPR